MFWLRRRRRRRKKNPWKAFKALFYHHPIFQNHHPIFQKHHPILSLSPASLSLITSSQCASEMPEPIRVNTGSSHSLSRLGCPWALLQSRTHSLKWLVCAVILNWLWYLKANHNSYRTEKFFLMSLFPYMPSHSLGKAVPSSEFFPPGRWKCGTKNIICSHVNRKVAERWTVPYLGVLPHSLLKLWL